MPHQILSGWASRVFHVGGGAYGKVFEENVDAFGYHFATIGAGPEGGADFGGCFGNMIGDFNRPTDISIAPVEIRKLPLSPFLENKLIEQLIQLTANYDDDLPYGCSSANQAQHNSNSFVAGLLDAARIKGPRGVQMSLRYPGWG